MNRYQAYENSRHIALLLAAIEHLKTCYCISPNRCLSLLIARNYGLLIEQAHTHSDRHIWLRQREIWTSSPPNNAKDVISP